jgi:RES domain-containing protein
VGCWGPIVAGLAGRRQIDSNVLPPPNPHEPQAVPPGRILPEVGRAIEIADLLRVVRPEVACSQLFRAHAHLPDERLEGAERLGAAPREKAANNRMSPAGIPMFYGAEDEATAIAEVRAAETDPARSAITVGMFEPIRDLYWSTCLRSSPCRGCLTNSAPSHEQLSSSLRSSQRRSAVSFGAMGVSTSITSQHECSASGCDTSSRQTGRL